MAYESEAIECSEMSANRIGPFTENAKTGVVELIRGWQKVTDTRKQSVLDYLKTIVTVTNPKYDNGKATATGLFRVATSGWNDQKQLYYQVLRLGWASTVLTESNPDDEWQIQSGSDSRSDARSFTFLRRNVASTAVNAAVTALRTLGAWTNPTIQGEAKTGSYAFANIVPAQQDDGSYWITIEAIKTATITAAADLAALAPVRLDTHDIENPFGLEGGYSAHVGRKPKDGIVLTFRALSTGSRTVLMALTDAQLQGILSVDEQAKYEFIKRDLQEDAGNTLKLVLAYQYVPLATSITAETARLVGITRKNQSNKIIIEISWPRINPANIDTVMATALFTRDTVTDPVVEGKTYTGEYLVNTTQAPMTDNDGIRIVQTMTKAGDQSLDIVTGKDPDHKVYEFFRWDISATDIAEFMTETGGEAHDPKLYNWGTPEIGKTKNVSIQKNADESFNLVAIFSNTDDLTKLELFSGTPGKLTIQDTYANTSEKAYGWNIPVASLKTYSDYYAPAPKVVNQRNKFNISRQTEHVFDFQGERETFVPVDSGWIVAEDDEFKTVSIRAGAFILSATLADGQDFGRPASVPVNVKYDQQFKENDLGSFDGRLVKTEFYKQDDGGIIIKDDQFQTITKRVGKYLQSSDITTGDAFQRPSVIPDNTTYELVVVDNDVGTHDITKTTILFKKVEKETVIEDDEEKTVTRKEGKYLTTAEVAADYARGVAVDGTTVELLPVVPNDVGTFSAGKITTVVKNQTNVTYEQDYSKLATITENTAAASPLGSPTPAVGHIKSVVNKERPDGKIVTKAVDEEELDQEVDGGKSSILEDVAVNIHTSGSAVAVSGGTTNVEVEVLAEPTAGGRVKTKKVTTTKKTTTLVNAVVTANDAEKSEATTVILNNTSTPAAVTSSGTYEEVDVKSNGVGGIDVVKKTVSEKNQTAAGGKSGALEDVAVAINTSGSTIPVSGGGTNVEVEIVEEPTRGGKLKTRKVTTTKKSVTLVNNVQVADAADKSETLTVLLNSTAVPPVSASSGTYIESDANSNGVGGVNVISKTVTEKDQTAAGGRSTLLETVAIDEHTSGATVAVPAGAQNVQVDVVESPTKGGKLQTKKVTSTLQPWDGGSVVVADDGVVKLTQQILKNQTTAPTASQNQEVKLSDNGRGGFDAVKMTKALSSGASGTKYKHSSNVRDFDYSVREVKTPTWSVTTNSDVDAYTTGYNIWRASMTRSRNIETTITKTYTMTEPASLVAMPSIEGTTEGEGTSFFKDAVERDGVWEIIDKKVVTGPWTAWGKNTLTWIAWIQTTVGSGS